jgi:GNAT superfamily N-acetyltransferase
MGIIAFDQIRDYYEFMKLMHSAFGWAESLERIRKMRRLDPRYRNPYGFALQEGKRLLGFVGTVDVPMRTLEGRTEMVGGIHSVSTDPEVSRSGVATRLIEHSHRYFQELGYRFSFLCTSRSLVAHRLYEKLGYSDISRLEQCPRAYRSFPEPKRDEPEAKRMKKLDSRRIRWVFECANVDKTGCAVRVRNWPQVILEERELKTGDVIVRPDGYAFTSTWGRTLFIDEWIALSPEACRDIYLSLQRRRKSAWIVAQADGAVLQAFLKEQEFSFAYGRYGVFMVKPLARASFESVFGDRFHFSRLDAF